MTSTSSFLLTTILVSATLGGCLGTINPPNTNNAGCQEHLPVYCSLDSHSNTLKYFGQGPLEGLWILSLVDGFDYSIDHIRIGEGGGIVIDGRANCLCHVEIRNITFQGGNQGLLIQAGPAVSISMARFFDDNARSQVRVIGASAVTARDWHVSSGRLSVSNAEYFSLAQSSFNSHDDLALNLHAVERVSISHSAFEGFASMQLASLGAESHVEIAESQFVGGTQGVRLVGASGAIRDSTFRNFEGTAVVAENSALRIENVSFEANQFAVQSIGTMLVDARGSWWNATNGPAMNPAPSIQGQERVSGFVLTYPHLEQKPR